MPFFVVVVVVEFETEKRKERENGKKNTERRSERMIFC